MRALQADYIEKFVGPTYRSIVAKEQFKKGQHGIKKTKPDNYVSTGSYTEDMTKPTRASITKFYERAAERLMVPKKQMKRVTGAMKRHRTRHATQVLIYGIPKGERTEQLMVTFWDIGKRSLQETANHYLSNTNAFKRGAPIGYDIDTFISNYGGIRPEAIKKHKAIGVITKVAFKSTYTKG